MAKDVWITEELKDRDGKVITRELGALEVPPSIDLTDRRKLAGAVAAQQVLTAGGSTNEAIDAAIKAQRGTPEPVLENNKPVDPELEQMIKYAHAIARLSNGNYDDLTPLGMLEVAMLCPHPVVPFEDWKARMKAATGQ